jgi:hypothetical protein
LIITLFGADEGHARREINKHPCVEFNICMNGSKLDLPILQELCNPKALRSGIRKINFFARSLSEREPNVRAG